ncbi:PREDICTED: WEB family protein At2g40480 [Tarenaya hassleriana]|uniref:WEB family protein At2g40480 n=1 Tax=Tarenaya hassleriana TaxID=28532 RepID=UPI00053C656D|nr:PREDICTED: WEB family protein At2g40480 [Tarenaya hassleriana]
MSEERRDRTAEVIPGTPGIREVRAETGSDPFGFRVDPASSSPGPGIRRVSLRAEIDTSPPFGSVQEAVTRFGGRGSWVPFKLGDHYNGVGEFDIKRMEEKAAELEKDLIVKELETLDVLEALGSTKRIVEDLKRQLQQEALRCMSTPEHVRSDIKEMDSEHCNDLPHNPLSSPDLILMELKQAKMNLGKTINDLGVIQSSVESLNTKMKEEKDFLETARTRLTFEFAGELNRRRVKPQIPDEGEIFKAGVPNSPRKPSDTFLVNPPREQVKMVAETDETGIQQQKKTCLRTAEMRLIAARKMEEAARAAEALAFAEMTGLSSGESEDPSEFQFPEPPPRSPLTPKALNNEEFSANISSIGILRKLEEATEEVKQSKQALEVALSQVEIAGMKQLAAEDALRRWNRESWKDPKARGAKNSTKGENFHPSNQNRRSFFGHLTKPERFDDLPKPVLKPNISMRDVLSRKQVQTEDFAPERQSEGQITRRNVNLSQMLNELKEEVKYPARAEKETNDEKQFVTQRRKFGFIHISLPLQKQSKKKTQSLNMVS